MEDRRRNSDQRPSPETLLEAARSEEDRVDKEKIFVIAAPGVGKTYEMLQKARALLREGKDNVIGVVETHGRAETEALLQGQGDMFAITQPIPKPTLDIAA
jgi:two-component system, OmpR family, sensor histidine kinase KdpD